MIYIRFSYMYLYVSKPYSVSKQYGDMTQQLLHIAKQKRLEHGWDSICFFDIEMQHWDWMRWTSWPSPGVDSSCVALASGDSSLADETFRSWSQDFHQGIKG